VKCLFVRVFFEDSQIGAVRPLVVLNRVARAIG
jgi:hypothetical protein